MNKWNVRLLSASYRQEGDLMVLELFGKTDDGRSITVLDRSGFRPYFFIVGATEDVKEGLRKDPEVLKVEDTRLLHKGVEREVTKVTILYPYKVPDYRNKLKSRFEILAADIPFHHRYIYDKDMDSCIRVYGKESQGNYSTELIVEMNSFENIEPFNPSLKILSFDIENSIRDDTLYTICYVIGNGHTLEEGTPIQGTETEIIQNFNEVIRREDPDVISGYNIDNYDIPKIIERAKANNIPSLPWGRDGSDPRQISGRFWRVKGRLVLDAWWSAKKELHPKQETLNAVSSLLLGEQKLDVDPKHIDEEWQKDPDKVIRYCTKDAELSLRILLSVDSLRKGMDLASVSMLPVEDVLSSGSSQLIDSILIRRADREGVAVPLMGGYSRTDQIEGGYVHSIEPGLYHWVCVLDFKSMYPSLIISNNICFTTLSKEGDIVSPNGVRYLSVEKRKGLLPTILKELMQKREESKALAKNAANEEERHYYNGLQEALKVLMNSFYGVFASSFYRFTDKNIGSSITAWARERVKTIIKELQAEGVTVVYSDTDSVFIQSPYPDLAGSKKFGEETARRYSREGGQLEFEKILEPFFSHGKKKRYVGRVLWPEKGEMLIRGYEIRRTDSFDLLSELLTSVFEKILDEDPEGAVALARKVIQKTLAGEVPVEKLVISRTCKAFNSYKDPSRMANVQAAKKMIDLGYEFIPGMKVSWVVTDAKKVPQEVEPYIPGRKFDARPDYRYYAERLAHAVARVTEVFDWKEEDLMMGSQQFTIFDPSFDSAASSQQSDEKKASKGKKTSLLDF